MGASPAGGQGSQRTLVVIVVTLLVVMCCCAAVVAPIAWSCGDVFMGTASECSPLLPP